MKRNIKEYLFRLYKRAVWEDKEPPDQTNVLDHWPDLKLCVESHYKTHPGMKRYHRTARQPIEFKSTKKFMKSLNKHCTTDNLKSQFITALTKIVYKIPCGGLCDTAIKERTNLWHFYVSDSWRVFYRKKNNYILLEELSPHKKQLYSRRY
jgi:hypothetical protein